MNACRIPFSKTAEYFCECPERHKLKHVKPSGKAHKRSFTAYFAHITNGKRQRESSICGPGGESLQHRLAKHRLREYVNVLSFATKQCTTCGTESILECKDYSIKLEMRSDDGLWRYDCMLYDTDGVKRYALEVVHKHFTGQVKADATRQAGLGIAEFAVADVMGLGPMPRKLDNILVMRRECETCQQKELEVGRVKEMEQEVRIWQECSTVVYNAMMELWESKAFTRSLAFMKSDVDRATAILYHYQKKLWFETHRWGRISLHKRLIPSLYGLVLNVDGTEIPAEKAFLMVTDRSWEFNAAHGIRAGMKSVWQRHSICKNLVFGLTSENVINRLGEIQAGKEVLLTNQLYAILKKIEDDQQICSQCGAYGHKSEVCTQKFCNRCGRGGHLSRDCFAKRSVTGAFLQ